MSVFDTYVNISVGQIFEAEERLFKIAILEEDENGTPELTAECLTPTKEDGGKVWWSFTVNDPEDLVLYTVH